jgi:hypothetical protein
LLPIRHGTPQVLPIWFVFRPSSGMITREADADLESPVSHRTCPAMVRLPSCHQLRCALPG